MHKFLAAFIILAVTTNAFAVKDDKKLAMWNIQDWTNRIPGHGDFVIGGCIGKNCSHGTWDDEYAVIGVVAQQIVEHGGYFCPYQLQCAHHKRSRYLDLFIPVHSGNWTDKCAWLCESGYSGANCMPAAQAPAYCDTKSYMPNKDGKYGGLKLKTYGKRDGYIAENVFANSRYNHALLGVIKFLDHGVIATPINIECDIKNSVTWVKDITRVQGDQKLLCATGYTANESNTDCVPIDTNICALQNISLCPNFDKSGYDSSIHYLEESGGCAKFFCKEPGTAFPAVGKYTCEECAPTIKCGVNPSNGVCVKCRTGQYYDKASNTCKAAAAYSKTDMQYGAGLTKSSRDIKQQCWTIAYPEEYKVCVTNGAGQKQN